MFLFLFFSSGLFILFDFVDANGLHFFDSSLVGDVILHLWMRNSGENSLKTHFFLNMTKWVKLHDSHSASTCEFFFTDHSLKRKIYRPERKKENCLRKRTQIETKSKLSMASKNLNVWLKTWINNSLHLTLIFTLLSVKWSCNHFVAFWKAKSDC